jgi:hypothetical protein
MSARVEAAAKEMCYVIGVALTDDDLRLAGNILAAADAVMFDEAAVERAVHALAELEGSLPSQVHPYRMRTLELSVRAVIAALKGDDK